MTTQDKYEIRVGDNIELLKKMPDQSVHCVITSPPYWGLRDYGTGTWEGGDEDCDHVANPNATKKFGNEEFNKNCPSREMTKTKGYYEDVCPKCGAVRTDSQLGQEDTPQEFVENLVGLFREIRRVLRDDGTVWLNLGDTYMGGGNNRGQDSTISGKQKTNQGAVGQCKKPKHPTIKPKNLVGIPWRVALALQDDGWILRQDIIWSKPNPMPESVRDRCTKAHEYIFLLAKNKKYYYDNEAIKEDAGNWGTRDRTNGKYNSEHNELLGADHAGLVGKEWEENPKRNKRSVWHVAPKPFAGAHFAVYPTELIEPCILAGTSKKGCCSGCGKPWERVVERTRIKRSELPKDDPRYRPNDYHGAYEEINGKGDAGYSESKTTGWQPTCNCESDVVPCVVLDPFSGSGTTGIVSINNNRDYIGLELNPEYAELSHNRITKECPNTLLEFMQ